MPSAQLEGLADKILGGVCTAWPSDAFVLADAYGLLLTPVGPYDEGFDGREIRFNSRVSHRDQQEYVIRCVAREALARARVHASHASIARLARALMLPRRRFDPRSSFAALLARHPNASAAMIGARKGDFAAPVRRAVTV